MKDDYDHVREATGDWAVDESAIELAKQFVSYMGLDNSDVSAGDNLNPGCLVEWDGGDVHFYNDGSVYASIYSPSLQGAQHLAEVLESVLQRIE